MKNNANNKKFIILIILAAFIIALVAFFMSKHQTQTLAKFNEKNAIKSTPKTNKQDEISKSIEEIDLKRKNSNLLKILPSDIVLGDKNAPVLMIEYASLSCPHCSSFTREAFDRFKEEYIETGKVKFVYRDFPLNKQALIAGMIALCQAKDNENYKVEKYYSTLKILFKTQDSWAFDPLFEEKLEGIIALDGMRSERFKTCIEDKKIQDQILDHRMKVSESLEIHSTPSFFVNGEISEGYVDYLTLQKLIDKKLSEKEK